MGDTLRVSLTQVTWRHMGSRGVAPEPEMGATRGSRGGHVGRVRLSLTWGHVASNGVTWGSRGERAPESLVLRAEEVRQPPL
eukprot:1127901-Prymnesium_polylepis.1